MCDAYENDPNSFIISYEEMFDILLKNIHEGFIVDVSFKFLYEVRANQYDMCSQNKIIKKIILFCDTI